VSRRIASSQITRLQSPENALKMQLHCVYWLSDLLGRRSETHTQMNVDSDHEARGVLHTSAGGGGSLGRASVGPKLRPAPTAHSSGEQPRMHSITSFTPASLRPHQSHVLSCFALDSSHATLGWDHIYLTISRRAPSVTRALSNTGCQVG
jgi:hypothetical protein